VVVLILVAPHNPCRAVNTAVHGLERNADLTVTDESAIPYRQRKSTSGRIPANLGQNQRRMRSRTIASNLPTRRSAGMRHSDAAPRREAAFGDVIESDILSIQRRLKEQRGGHSRRRGIHLPDSFVRT